MKRRAFNPTAEQRGWVEALSSHGVPEAEICLLIKYTETGAPIGLETLRKARLRTRLLDVGRKPGDLLQLLLGRGERRAGKDDSANRMHVSDPGEPGRAMPAVDRQGQRAAHPGIVEWLSFVVGLDDPAAVPVALLQGDLVAQRAYQLVAHGRWKPAELDRCTIPADCLDPDCLLIRIDAGEPVEVGQPFVVVVGVAPSSWPRAGLVRAGLVG